MPTMHRTALLLLSLLFLTFAVDGHAFAQGLSNSSSRVDVRVAPERDAVVAGSDLPVAVTFDHDEHWHIHTHAPVVPTELGSADMYIATAIEVDVPEGSPLTPHPQFIQWPDPVTIEVAFGVRPVDYDVYEGEAVAFLPVTVASDAEPGEYSFDVLATYQACDDNSCLMPVRGERHTVTVRVVSAEEAATLGSGEAADGEAAAAVFAGFDVGVWERIRSGDVPVEVVAFDLFGLAFALDINTVTGLLLIVLMAGVGGFLLNLTPCVLPVIPIKIMGLSQMAGSRGRCLALGATMAAGIISFWLAIGIAVASVSGFLATNQLFQYPLFTIGVGAFIAIMAIGMCGLFTVRLPRFVYMIEPRHDSFHGSYVFGIMAAVLSTPCTAPFMGAAAAGAVTQRPDMALIVFLAIGAGMAMPYLVLAAFPKLVEKMPRTGPASELIKQVMGMLMLAAAAYFIGTGITGLFVVEGEPPSNAYWWVVGGLGVAAGAWLAWRTFRITPSLGRRVAFAGLGLAFILAGSHIAWHFTRPGPIEWVYYTPDRFEQALERGDVVMMEFTANWCLNCKALEEAVLYTDRVTEALRQPGVVAMKVDLTGNNESGNAKLASVNRITIPLLIVFSPDGSEVFKGDFYTVDQVLGAIEEAKAASAVAQR
ncbi:cytochrome c biogenesis protein CcdA [Phycisphaerales bacterium AB-hyl4]|uniref:Cytochrome c biogenesis protein CcdA n=1 Tax=Natronomicrosphaera hydrolytica TaxID=3242702 RepID=A0ABV4U2H0_9BACT